jgi:hypothetical protein
MVKITYWLTTGINGFKEYLHQVYFARSDLYKGKILAIFLFTLGVFLLWKPLGLDHKISITLIFIAIFIFLFFPEKNRNEEIELYILFFLIGWLIIMAFITDDQDFNTFYFSVVLGILIVKEFANGYLTPPLKKKLTILTLLFFSLSILLVAEKIINIFNI